MRDVEEAVARRAARRGIVTTERAAGVGADADDLEALRWRGVLVSLARGVDRLRDHPFDLGSRCQAALDLAPKGSVLGLRSAARLAGFYAYRSCDAIEVLGHRGLDHRLPIGRFVQTSCLPAAHVTTIDGFPVTTPARTFFDLCGDPDGGLRVSSPAHERRMARVYNDALARRGLSFAQEAAVVVVTAKRGRRGSTLSRRTLLRFPPETEPTHSDGESLFAELVAAHALEPPERQVALSGPEGWIGTVDFYWPAVRLVVEIDSTWHDGPLDRASDAARDAALQAAGYVVRRYRHRDLIDHPAAVIAELRQLGAAIAGSSG